jgi:hypothetical protein
MLQAPRHLVGGADDRQQGEVPRVALPEILRWTIISMLLALLILVAMFRTLLSLR